MPASKRAAGSSFARRDLIEALNGDLAREYQAIIAYVVYAETLKGPQYMHIAGELKKHAAEELSHAQTISRQIAYLGGSPTTKPMPVKETEDAKAMLRADLDNERETIRQYRRRVLQCEELGELAIAESIREILRQEQDHLIELAEALEIDPPDPGIA